MNLEQIRYLLIEPTLKELDRIVPYSQKAADFIFAIGKVESNYSHIKQPGGPALGFWQIEPKTHDDLWVNYLNTRTDLAFYIRGAATQRASVDTMHNELLFNLRYQVLVARAIIRRVPEKLPYTKQEMAAQWKKYYCTSKCKGSEQDFIDRLGDAL